MSEGLFGDPRVDAVLDVLYAVEGWPVDPAKDDALVRKWMATYPWVDLRKAIPAWDVWRHEHEVEMPERKNWVLRLHTWLKEGRRYGIEKGQNRAGPRRTGSGTKGAGHPRPTSVAGSVADFGAVSRELDRW